MRKALLRAMELHHGQVRKDEVTPYIVHPIQAALILARAGADDDTIAAGLLHDTIEDTPYKQEALRKEFGNRITEMVLACSENKAIRDWDERKQELFSRLSVATDEAKLVKAADAFANMLDLTDAVVRTKGAFWKKFHASREQKIAYFGEVLTLTKAVLPAVTRSEYEHALAELMEVA